MLKAAILHGVKRAVITSSAVAVVEPLVDGKTYTVNDWSDVELQSAYGKSKTLAEHAAWELTNATSLELCTVNPVFVMGPTLYQDKTLCAAFESGKLFMKLLRGGLLPQFCLPVCDVRDVAKIHVDALTSPQAAGARFLAKTQSMFIPDLVLTISRLHPKLHIKVRTTPKWLMYVLRFCTQDASDTYPHLGKTWHLDTSLTTGQGKLKPDGFSFILLEETLRDMVDDFIGLGAVE